MSKDCLKTGRGYSMCIKKLDLFQKSLNSFIKRNYMTRGSEISYQNVCSIALTIK